MSTVGLLLLIDEIIVHTTQGVPLNYPALFSDVIIRVGPFNLRGDLMFVFVLGCLCMVLLLRCSTARGSGLRRAPCRSSRSPPSSAASASRA